MEKMFHQVPKKLVDSLNIKRKLQIINKESDIDISFIFDLQTRFIKARMNLVRRIKKK